MKAAKVRSAHRILVTWSDSERAEVDLAPMIFRYGVYAPLRTDPAAFETMRLGEDGVAVEWLDGAVDMSADAIWHLWTTQHLTSDELKAKLKSWSMTVEAAAKTFQISKRQLAYFLAGQKPIPRYIALAARALDDELR